METMHLFGATLGAEADVECYQANLGAEVMTPLAPNKDHAIAIHCMVFSMLQCTHLTVNSCAHTPMLPRPSAPCQHRLRVGPSEDLKSCDAHVQQLSNAFVCR